MKNKKDVTQKEITDIISAMEACGVPHEEAVELAIGPCSKHHISNTCQHEKTRMSLTYDAVYCLSCMEWLESKCVCPECDYCRGRPSLAPLDLEEKEKEKLNAM